MEKTNKKILLIVELVIYIGFIVLFSLILSNVFNGIVVGRTESKDLIYSDINLLIPKLVVGFGILVSAILLVVKSLELSGKLNNESVSKKIDSTLLIILLLITVLPVVLFNAGVDKYNGFSFGLSFSIIITIITVILVKTIDHFSGEKEVITVHQLAEGAILAALAIVLSLISKLLGFLELPQGGSFSLSMLPLVIYGFRRGPKMGFIMGFTYSIMNFIIDGSILHWGSIFFDYLIPFSLVGAIPGLFSKKAQKGSLSSVFYGVLLAGLARYVFHGLSGVIFFAEYAGELNPWFYSFIVYNLPYMGISTIGTLVFTVLLSGKFIVTDTRLR